jgi:DNA-binding GntR family transcriptional regulator
VAAADNVKAVKESTMSDRSLKANAATNPAPRLSKATSLREQIYEHLRERINAGKLTFDDRLVDVDIAAEFGVSRMPVREALMQFVHDGMIESTTRGFVLRRRTDREIDEIFQIRRLLEPAAAAGAASNMTESALRQMSNALDACARAHRAGDATAFILANAKFRGAWIAQVPNTQLASAISRYIDHVQAVRLQTLPSAAVRNDVLARMKMIHEAFRKGNATEASKLVEGHVLAALEFYRSKPVPLEQSTATADAGVPGRDLLTRRERAR